MIQANELRIGDWVNINVEWGSITEITGFRIDSIFLSSDKNYRCKMNDKDGTIEVDLFSLVPILLTEEILLMCGFEKKHTIWKNRWMELWYSSYAECYQIRLLKIGSDTEKTINIESLHQLQNLYFTLTGKELEVEF